MRTVSLAIVGLLLGLPYGLRQASAQENPILPVDEAARDPEFFVFRARLQRAVAAHDVAAVLDVVAPDMLNDLGGDGGRDEFRDAWNLTRPDQSHLWPLLAEVLALGGTFANDSTFYAPYPFGRTPGDPFETLVVLGRDLRVHGAPDTAAHVVAAVSFEAVRIWRAGHRVASDADTTWTPVELTTGETGWIRSRFVRSPIDYRAGFVRRSGRWWLQALVSGD